MCEKIINFTTDFTIMKTSSMKRRAILALMILMSAGIMSADDYRVNYEASAIGTAGSGDFAPYFLSAMSHGKIVSAGNAWVEGKAWRTMSADERFSYGFGIDLMAGYASSVDYARYNKTDGQWFIHPLHPSRGHIQQLYGEVKYRGVFLTVGMKERGSALLNTRLSSGDLIESGNARPIPQARVGFIDFQDIPFTRGWVQIQGELSYGKMTDSDWWENHFNRFNYHYTTGEWYHYKRCYFRTKPSERFSATVGMQASAHFGGTTYNYFDGENVEIVHNRVNVKAFWDVFIPKEGNGEAYYLGNHVGSWDVMLRYRMRNNDEIKGYMTSPWEDGSGIGKLNGFDGVWGVEYRRASKGIVNAVLVEYLDFTNQSGPIHYDPDDVSGGTITDRGSGADNYYNNAFYNSYANYGMSIGTPALMAPVYNRDGYLAYTCNRMRGFHAAIEGSVTHDLDYRAKVSYRKAWGEGFILLPEPVHSTSVMVEADYRIPSVKGLSVKGSLALDRGDMPGNAFGALVTVSYNGSIKF